MPQVHVVTYRYSSHNSPELRFDSTGQADVVSKLIAEVGKRPLTESEKKVLESATINQQPWLEWAGKQEQHQRESFVVEPVALHIHERVSAQAIMRCASREDVQRDLFADPQQDYREAVQFYRHDVDWANRLILGDSLQVMASLAKRENLAGQVQMIYVDPPYGINYSSNFQPQMGNRNVKDREKDLTREPEMVTAYRDTWTLGVHSYLTYLRDRLIVARELLTESGSIFVQIGDENVHRIRAIMDEVFGDSNYVANIQFRTKIPLGTKHLAAVGDYVLWFAKKKDSLKYRKLLFGRDSGDGTQFKSVRSSDGHIRSMTKEEANGKVTLSDGESTCRGLDFVSAGRTETCVYDAEFEGQTYRTTSGKSWKTNQAGFLRLKKANRILGGKTSLSYLFLHDDYPVQEFSNMWVDTQGASEKSYVVQTSDKVIQRCLLMATDPGDLVLDPTCGGGTTAYVAEKWGRRWITIDTSRVALSLARTRILCASYPYYILADSQNGQQKEAEITRTVRRNEAVGENIRKGFVYERVPHITLKSIANNVEIDAIWERWQAVLEPLRESLNTVLKTTWKAWDIPLEADDAWSDTVKDLHEEWCQRRVDRQQEIDAAISAERKVEYLYDQPYVETGKVRVSGPFSVEGVRPEELSFGSDGVLDPTPNTFKEEEAYRGTRTKNISSYLTQMMQYLQLDGVTFLNNKKKMFAKRSLEALFEDSSGSLLHSHGCWDDAENVGVPTVAVSFGPKNGPITALQVEEAIREARRYEELVLAGFSFEAEASAVVKAAGHPKLRVHLAQIRPDLHEGMRGLLKNTPNSELFTAVGQPDIAIKATADGWVCSVLGVDIYDPVTNTVASTGADKIEAWFLDSDFDGRCFCVTQAFFPHADGWGKIAKALGSNADLDVFEAFKGTTSVPFERGQHGRIAVKVIDPRGNEVMVILSLGES